MAGTSLQAFEADWQMQCLVERGLEIISEASRRLDTEFEAAWPGIPWKKVAGIGNVLRHDYRNIAPPVLWALVRDHLPPLLTACETELAIALPSDPHKTAGEA